MSKELPPDEATTLLLFILAIILALMAVVLSSIATITLPVTTATNQGETDDTSDRQRVP